METTQAKAIDHYEMAIINLIGLRYWATSGWPFPLKCWKTEGSRNKWIANNPDWRSLDRCYLIGAREEHFTQIIEAINA